MAEAKIVSLNSNPEKPDPRGKYDPGDVVSLASGGHLMTVRKANRTVVACDWTNEAGDLCSAEFPPAMLQDGDVGDESEAENEQEA
jgi:uncharacterized protein YodC (DUF2158 family)